MALIRISKADRTCSGLALSCRFPSRLTYTFRKRGRAWGPLFNDCYVSLFATFTLSTTTNPRPSTTPLDNMSSPDLCKFQVIIYGTHKKRHSMRLHLSVPVNLNRVRTDSFAHQGFIKNTVMNIQNEVKHSACWSCCNCGMPRFLVSFPSHSPHLDFRASYISLRPPFLGEEAHEFIHSPASYIQNPDPFVVDFVHAVCRLGGACRRAIERENRVIAAETGAPWQNCLAPAMDVPSKEPLASSCAICHSTGPVQTCSRCKTIRYCGTACQRRDFPRHKTICKMVSAVSHVLPSPVIHGLSHRLQRDLACQVTKVEKNFQGVDVDGL